MKIGEPFNPFRKLTGIFIPTEILRLRHLSPRSQICCGRLLRYAGRNGSCYPSVETLAAEIGVGEPPVARSLNILWIAQMDTAETAAAHTEYTQGGFGSDTA
jgi:hypothetical protein